MVCTVLTRDNLDMFVNFLRNLGEGEKVDLSNKMAIGAIEDGVACGVMVVSIHGTIAEIGWLYVAPAYRGRGVASRMVDYLIQNAADIKIDGIFSEYNVENADLLFAVDRLFVKRGAKLDADRWYYYQIPIETLLNADIYKKASALTLEKLKVESLETVNSSYIYDYANRNLYLQMNDYYKKYSVFFIEDKKLQGALLVRRSSKEMATVEILDTEDGDSETVLGLLLGALKCVDTEIKAGRETSKLKIELSLTDADSVELPRKLFHVEPESIIDLHIATIWLK